MRGTYTAGVLEAFAEGLGSAGAVFDAVVACSAGACNAASYLAEQPLRNRRVYLDFLDGHKLIRWSRLLTGGDIMDIDYLTDDVTLRLCPLDLDRLRACPTPLYMGVMDSRTGGVRYLSSHHDDLRTAFRATCALPVFYRRTVSYQGSQYIDGGVADPVPVRKALQLGMEELVVVLTSSVENRTGKLRGPQVWLHLLVREPAVRRALSERHLRFREAAKILSSPGPGIDVHVVRPSRPLRVSRTTRDRTKLEQACDQGYEDGRRFLRQYQSKTASP